MATVQVKRTDILLVPFSKLKVLDGFNDRQDYGDIDALAESLHNEGPKVPLKGYKEGDNYVVIVGHRRHSAAEIVKKKYDKDVVFPFLPYPRTATKRDMLLDTLLTNDGKELNPLEKSAVVKKLATDEKMDAKAIAGAIGGVSTVYVKNLLKLAEVPEKVKKHIQAGNVSSTLVIGYLKNKDADMEELAKQIEANLQPDQGLFKDAAGKRKGSKKKVAKVTKKNLTKKTAKQAAKENEEKASSSMVELKRFRKQHNDIFQNKGKQEAFEFVCDILDNKLTYSHILTFFTGK